MPEHAGRGAVDRLRRALPYRIIVPIALLLGLAPFQPQPHLVEKIRMLAGGTLHRPIDIFDLVLHGLPVALVVVRVGADLLARTESGASKGAAP